MSSVVAVLMTAGTMLLPVAAAAQSTPMEDVQVLTRGPVHEAFAETVSFDPQPGVIVRAAPPKPIEELPPEQQLVGDNVTWIPGYWAWDDERNDFLWVSGIWRNLPPGRQWIPGYWSDIGDGQYQWTSGYWADSKTTVVAYLATAPPPNIDIGPNIAAESEDQSWIPGNWVWAESRYLWRPGYWMPLRTDWTWVPSRYCWNRRGYVYVDGYWDYAVANRGVLFAPVYFNRHVYDSSDYYYTPSIVIALNVFTDHLFVRPRCGHYYFGDYYAPRYRDDGYYASYAWHTRCRGYDPVYAYERWCHRGDRAWEGRRRADHDFFRDHEDVRPRHTWTAMQEAGKNRYNDGRNRLFANPLSSIARTPAEGQQFRTLDTTRREQLAAQGQEIRKFGQARHQVEARARDNGTGSSKNAGSDSLARSPVVGRQPDEFASRDAPPRRPEARGSNIRVNPATKAMPQPGTSRTDDSRKLAGRPGGTSDRMDARGPSAASPQSRPAAKAATTGANRDGSDRNAVRQVPGRQADAGKVASQQPAPRQAPGSLMDNSRPHQTQATPQRSSQASSQIHPAPQRQAQAAPQRQVQPQAQFRQAPQRQVQAAPQRQVQPQAQFRQAPQRQIQVAPQRQVQPQAQFRQAPQRQIQAAPQRQVQPQAQIRQAPQRQIQAAPQRQVQPGPPSGVTDDREKKREHSRY